MFENLPSFNEVLSTFEDPQRMHAIIVHLPIGCAVLGFILTLGVALTGSKMAGLRWTTVFIFLLGTLAALWTVQTGEEAEHHLLVKPAGEAAELLEKHEELAEYFWVGLATTGGLILISTLRITWLRSITLLLAVLASAASVMWVAAIGHYGGEMVYRHSVGVPSAGVDHDHKDHVTPPKDAAKDKSDKDKDKGPEPVKDKDKTDETPVTPPKVEEKDKTGERKLPETKDKDKSIFDP